MAKLQIDIPEELNKKLKLKKAMLGHSTLQKTLIQFMEEKLNEWQYDAKL